MLKRREVPTLAELAGQEAGSDAQPRPSSEYFIGTSSRPSRVQILTAAEVPTSLTVGAMKEWQVQKSELFTKRVVTHPRPIPFA